jgi:hypothetical protein
MTAPTMSAPISGGIRAPSAGSAASSTNAAAIGAAIQKSSRTANTRSSPKRRNTPATIAITTGIGSAAHRPTDPPAPAEREHQQAGRVIGSDDLGKRQVA